MLMVASCAACARDRRFDLETARPRPHKYSTRNAASGPEFRARVGRRWDGGFSMQRHRLSKEKWLTLEMTFPFRPPIWQTEVIL